MKRVLCFILCAVFFVFPAKTFGAEYVDYAQSDLYHVEKTISTDYGTILYYWAIGTPHGKNPTLKLIKNDGVEINLSESVPRKTLWCRPEHENIELSEDGKTLTFSVYFEDRSETSTLSGDATILHEAGRYYFEADLESGSVISRFVPVSSVSAWAEADVSRAIELGFVPPEYKEKCKQNITREDFFELIYNLISSYSDKELPEINLSESLNTTDTANKKLITLWSCGIIKGKGTVINSYHEKTLLAPKDLLTREEAAVIIVRTIDKFFPTGVTKRLYEYSDSNEISDWAYGSIQTISNLGIMKGVENERFAPKENYTTEQAIITLLRVYNISLE